METIKEAVQIIDSNKKPTNEDIADEIINRNPKAPIPQIVSELREKTGLSLQSAADMVTVRVKLNNYIKK